MLAQIFVFDFKGNLGNLVISVERKKLSWAGNLGNMVMFLQYYSSDSDGNVGNDGNLVMLAQFLVLEFGVW